MKHASDTPDTYLLIAYQSLSRIFIEIFSCNGTVFFSNISFSTQTLRKVLYFKPKYRAILFKIIYCFIPFHFVLVISAVGISVPSIFCNIEKA